MNVQRFEHFFEIAKQFFPNLILGFFANHRRTEHDSRTLHFPGLYLQTFSLGIDETSPSETGPTFVQTFSISGLRVGIDPGRDGDDRNGESRRRSPSDYGFDRGRKSADSSSVRTERREQNQKGWI